MMTHVAPGSDDYRRWISDACEAFRQQWELAQRPVLIEALRDAPAGYRSFALEALLRIELAERKRRGEVARSEDYAAHPPDDQKIICELIFEIFGPSTRVQLPDSHAPIEPADIEPVAEPHPRKIGRYEIKERLGQGGCGTVYVAYDPLLDRDVAIKVPRSDRQLPGDQKAFALYEARLVADLKHPGIVQVYDVLDEHGRIAIVQELVPGGNLLEWCDKQHPEPNQFHIAKLMALVAEAVAAAHRKGIYHRDLKPANILMNANDQPLVADFGLALLADARHVAPYPAAGTPGYMSPEQVRGDAGQIDGRTDIWSIGVMLYQLLTRQLPFQSRSVEELQRVDVRSPRELEPSISEELSAICVKCLQRDKAQRYETADDLARALRRIQMPPPVLPAIPGIPAGTAAIPKHTTESLLETHANFQRSHHTRLAKEKDLRLDRYVWPGLAWEDPKQPGERQADEQHSDEQSPRRQTPIPGSDREPAMAVLQTLFGRKAEDGENVVLYDDAGMGKTAFTFQLVELLLGSAADLPFLKQHRPLVVRLEGRQFRDARGQPCSIADFLALELRTALEQQGEHVDAPTVELAVQDVLRDRRVVILVDAFDQMSDEDRQDLVKGWSGKSPRDQDNRHARQCHWLITGRPYALRKYERLLRPLGVRRLRIQGLTAEQQDRYFDDHATAPFFGQRKTKPLDWVCLSRPALGDDLAVPFHLREIRRLIELDLERGVAVRQISSTGELRSLVAIALLERALEQYALDAIPAQAESPDEPREQLHQLLSVCGVLAFQLMLEERYNASVDCVDDDYAVEHFLERARNRFVGGQRRACEHSRPLRSLPRWQWAVWMLEKIEFTHRGDIDSFNAQCRSFRDRKTMEWYAAYYLMNHASEDDLYGTVDGAGDRCVRAFAFDPEWLSNCWRQAIAMPNRLVRDEAAVMSLGVLFARPNETENGATRPCEHLWRAWERWLEPTVRSGRKLRGAEELIARFRAEIVSLCADEADADAQERARSLQFDEQRDRPDPTLSEPNKTQDGWYRRIPPAGDSTSFQGERPSRVVVSRFWLRKFVVTNAEYQLFDPHYRSRWGVKFDKPERPVVDVNWYMATMFCRWLGVGYQLPTEAQWEAACRANAPGPNARETTYWFGDDEPELAQHAWYGNYENTGNAERRTYGLEESRRAGGHENPWGLYDMHGNVWEWCADVFAEYKRSQETVIDPAVTLDDIAMKDVHPDRVVRGGSWYSRAGYCRSAIRTGFRAGNRFRFLGFRVCLVSGPVAVPPSNKSQ